MAVKKLEKNSGMVLVGVLVIVFFLSSILAVGVMRSLMQLKGSDQRVILHQSFYTAEAGVERAIFELRRNPNWGLDAGGASIPDFIVDEPLTTQVGGQEVTIGFYSITVSDDGIFNGWNTRRITSIGRDAVNDNTTIRSIEARVLIENPARFLVSTLGDLRIGSGADINADILGQDIYFDINASLPPAEQVVRVDGDIFYIRSVNDQQAAPFNIDPAVQFEPDSEIIPSPSITFAGVDLIRYESLANALLTTSESIIHTGDYNLQLGTLDPAVKLVYVDGNVTVSGEYESSLLVVASENIYIDFDIVPDPMSDPGNIPQIGLFAKQDVIIPDGAVPGNGDLNLEAFIMADGGGGSDGIFIAKGAKYSLGTLNFKGAIAVRGEGETAVDLNAFNIRDYNYNSELNENRSIPFSPFIVNIIDWRETTYE